MRRPARSFAVLLVLFAAGCGKRPIAENDGGAGDVAAAGDGGRGGAGAIGGASAGSNAGASAGSGGGIAGSSGGGAGAIGGASAGSNAGASAGSNAGASAGSAGGATAGAGGGATGTGGASAGTGPLRLLIFYTRWGTSYPEWWPTGSDRSFTMSAMLQALEPYKGELIMISGLTNANLAVETLEVTASLGSDGGDAQITLLTARPAGRGRQTEGPSLDAAIGDCGGAAGPPLRLAVGQFGFDDTLAISFADDGTALRGEHDPHAAAMRVLGHDVTAPDPNGDINAIYPALGAAQMDVAVEALAKGKACVVTLTWGDHFNPAVLGITGSDLHELSHDTIGLFEAVNAPETARIGNRFAKMQGFYAKQFASLLDRMRATPLGAGALLDQSVVVWISETGTGVDHQGYYIPVVIAGGGGGRLDAGRFIEIKPHLGSLGGFIDTSTIERTQGDLLQALANLWGIATFGDPRIARQTLTQIFRP